MTNTEQRQIGLNDRVGIKHRDGGYTDTGYVTEDLGDGFYRVDSDDPDRSDTSYEVHVGRLAIQEA